MRDIVEVLTHWQAGRSVREIARSLHVGRNTIARFIALAEAAGYHPGEPQVSTAEWRDVVCAHFPEAGTDHSSAFTLVAPFRDQISEWLRTNRPSTVWRRLHDEHHLPVSLPTFYRYLKDTWPDGYRPTAITILRDEPSPGEEAQIDFGYLGIWRDPKTQRRLRLWAFLLILAHSRHLTS